MATAGGGAARAEHVIKAAHGSTKPVVVCWPGGSLVRKGVRALDKAGVPLFATISSCAAALGAALAFREMRERPPRRRGHVVSVTVPAGPGALPWRSVSALLAHAGLRMASEVIVRNVGEAQEAASRLTYPVVVKALGPLHRTEVGGVRLGVSGLGELLDAVRAVRPLGEACLIQPMIEGVEVLVGALRDAEFGPLVMLAPGGVQAELYGERALAPAPCDADAAERLIRECRALDALLRGYRGGPAADRASLVETITRAAALAAGLGPRLVALDLNPVIVGPPGVGATVVDARIVLDP